MYCLTTGIKDFEKTKLLIKSYDIAEIRLDLNNFNQKEIKDLCSSHSKLIFTCRASKDLSTEDRLNLLKTAIKEGAGWIDLDIDYDTAIFVELNEYRKLYKSTKLIISYHNFENTPTNHFLFDKVIEMSKYEPDLKKIVCTSNGSRDNHRILTFNSLFKETIAFNMGKKGKMTRAACLIHGAPFTFVSFENEKTAPGQLERQEIEKLLASIDTHK